MASTRYTAGKTLFAKTKVIPPEQFLSQPGVPYIIAPPTASKTASTTKKTTVNKAKSTATATTKSIDTTAAYNALTAQNNAALAQAEALANQKQQLAENAYAENLAALESAYRNRASYLKSNYDSSLAQLQKTKDDGSKSVNTDIDKALQEAYVNAMKNQRDLPGSLSALGINGGAAESTLAGMRNSYGNARNTLETTRASQLAALLGTYQQSSARALQDYNTQLAADEKSKTNQQISLKQALADGIAEILTDRISAVDKTNTSFAAQLAALFK